MILKKDQSMKYNYIVIMLLCNSAIAIDFTNVYKSLEALQNKIVIWQVMDKVGVLRGDSLYDPLEKVLIKNMQEKFHSLIINNEQYYLDFDSVKNVFTQIPCTEKQDNCFNFLLNIAQQYIQKEVSQKREFSCFICHQIMKEFRPKHSDCKLKTICLCAKCDEEEGKNECN